MELLTAASSRMGIRTRRYDLNSHRQGRLVQPSKEQTSKRPGRTVSKNTHGQDQHRETTRNRRHVTAIIAPYKQRTCKTLKHKPSTK